MSLEAVKEQLQQKFHSAVVSVDQLRPPEGLRTGFDVIDDFLLWKGFPKGDLSLLHGQPGTGATSLFISTMKEVHRQSKWAAWINSDWELLPSHLTKRGIDLKKLLVVKKPQEESQLFWILQELISSSLFEIVGCHLREGLLKVHQLQKLKKLARTHKVSLVLMSSAKQWINNPLFSLIIECGRDFLTIRRALHRPTPFSFSGGMIHADFVFELTKSTRALLR
ncbi:MAG: recA protein [Pseudobdellovibrionaceae bacterium]|jgi:hypothetical protein